LDFLTLTTPVAFLFGTIGFKKPFVEAELTEKINFMFSMGFSRFRFWIEHGMHFYAVDKKMLNPVINI
jgi:hypothetical protein